MPHIATLPLLLKQLRLSTMLRHWESLLQQSEQKGWNNAQYLTALCEQELAERYRRRIERHTKESQLPPGKTLASFDFSQMPTAQAGQFEALARTAEWTHQARNLILFGASGVGKSHLAAAIGYGLIEQGVRVRYVASTALVQQLQLARQQLRLEDALAKLDKYRVLILDDIAYVKKSEHETQVLFELIAHRYETGSMIITSNRPFAEWDLIFPDQMMTVAAVDRLIHHATIMEITGDSYRRKEALRQRAETATTTTQNRATIIVESTSMPPRPDVPGTVEQAHPPANSP
ncbi:MAG: ATP-binding protein [Alphaproteobacteria bacterium]|nr:ATP-binding protein [Alphaproteobacteria bacterium]